MILHVFEAAAETQCVLAVLCNYKFQIFILLLVTLKLLSQFHLIVMVQLLENHQYLLHSSFSHVSEKMLEVNFFFAEVVDNFDWGAYLREGEETYSTIYADSDVSNKRPTSLSFLI